MVSQWRVEQRYRMMDYVLSTKSITQTESAVGLVFVRTKLNSLAVKEGDHWHQAKFSPEGRSDWEIHMELGKLRTALSQTCFWKQGQVQMIAEANLLYICIYISSRLQNDVLSFSSGSTGWLGFARWAGQFDRKRFITCRADFVSALMLRWASGCRRPLNIVT